MVIDNNEHHHHNQVRQSPDNEPMSTINERVMAMIQRITEPLYRILRWSRLSSRFDIEPQTFASHLNWLDSLIERLQYSSYWSAIFRRQESLPFLHSSNFAWFDPRNWLNRMDRESPLEYYNSDNEADSTDETIPGFMPANSPVTIPVPRQSLPARQPGLSRVRQFRTITDPALLSQHKQDVSAGDSGLEEQFSQSQGENELHPVYPHQIVTDSLLSRYVGTEIPAKQRPEQEPYKFMTIGQKIHKEALTTPVEQAMSHTGEYQQHIDSTPHSQTAYTAPLNETEPVEERASKFARVISKVWDKISSPLTSQLQQARRLIGENKTKDIPENPQPTDSSRQINLNITPPAEIPPEVSHQIGKKLDEGTTPEQPAELVLPMQMVQVRFSNTASAEITMPDEASMYGNEQTERAEPDVPGWIHSTPGYRILAGIAGGSRANFQETGSEIQIPGRPPTRGDFSGQRPATLSLALAPTARPTQTANRTSSQTTEAQQQSTNERSDESTPSYDPEQIAAEVYSILKRRLVIERERAQGIL